MTNLVTIGERKYLVDVGFGSDGPTDPMELSSDLTISGFTGQQISLCDYLVHYFRWSQRELVYRQRLPEAIAWDYVYVIRGPPRNRNEFDGLNLLAMTQGRLRSMISLHRFLFTNTIPRKIHGSIKLIDDCVMLTTSAGVQFIERFDTERERISAIRHYFGINLTESERITAWLCTQRPHDLERDRHGNKNFRFEDPSE